MSNKINTIFKGFKLLEKKTTQTFIVIAISSIVISFIELVGIGFIGTFIMFLTDIDSALESFSDYTIFAFLLNLDSSSIINVFLVSIIIFFLLKNLLIFIYFYFFNKFKLRFNLEISKKIFYKNIHDDYEYFLKQKKSKVIHDIKDESERFTAVFFSVLNLIKDIFLIIFFTLSLFVVDWKLSSIIFLVFLIFSVIIFTFIKKKLYFLGKDLTFFTSNFLKKLLETFGNMKFIKIRKLESFILPDTFFFQKKRLNVSFLQGIITSIPRLVLEIFAVSSLCFTIYFYINSSITIDKLIPLLSFIALSVIRMVPAVSVINQNLNNIISSIYSVEIVLNYLNSKNEKSFNFKKTDPVNTKERINKINFKDVSYKYKSKDASFEITNLNINLKQKDILGVIGKSGGGKTTFADLLLGLLKPDKGEILFNDKNIEDIDASLFNISYVPQNVNLIDENLNKNISFGSDINKLDMSKLEKAINDADLKQLKEKLNKNNIGEDGIEISGGQKQRIGIARALYNNPSLLVLDEPTSELDYSSEGIIMENLKKQEIDIIVLIAHRLNTLEICNKLIIFENGKVLDFGLKEEILRKHKELKKFFQKTF